MRSTALLLALLSLSSAPLLMGCSADAANDDVEETSEDQGELRALSAGEIVGTLAYGATLDVAYAGDNGKTRMYRAVKLAAAAGDAIDATVSGTGGADTVLYLLGSDFRTLRSNDNRAAGDKSSEIKTTLSKSGTYYLAFRTKNGSATTFTVGVNKTNAVTPPPPPPPPVETTTLDLFSDAVSGQESLSSAGVAALFSPGASEANLGQFVLAEHWRTCNNATGCSAFAGVTKIRDLQLPARNDYTTWWDTNTVHLPSGNGEIRGTAKLRTTQGGGIVLDIASTTEGDVEVQGIKLGSAETAWLGTKAQYCQNTSDYAHPVHCYGGSYLMEIGPWGTTNVRFKSIARPSYVYGRSAIVKTPANAQGSYYEIEYAFIASTTPAKTATVAVTGTTVTATF
ncbi:MAG: hypothetical protein U0235_30795 [Polyangiaceae bacterium]